MKPGNDLSGALSRVFGKVWKLQKPRSGNEDTTGNAGKGGQGAETPRLAGLFEDQGTEDSRSLRSSVEAAYVV